MNIKYIAILTKYTIFLLKEFDRKKPLWMLSKWNCSEISRIVGLKVLNDFGDDSKPFILKGNVTVTGLEKENNHDILGFFDTVSGEYIIVDPTIWQFFPKRKSILLGKFNSKEECINFVSEYYKGKWSLSEYISRDTNREITKWKKIIRQNCKEAPNWENSPTLKQDAKFVL